MKVGDYVRTTSGDIGIIIECPEKLKNEYGRYIWFETTNEQRPIISEYVVKSSPNIINLIEVKDYVNGYKITTIGSNGIYAEDEDGYLIRMFTKEDIKSVVTKEQFESMEYKVGE